jgi:peptide subunit release factor RF-3
MGRAAKVRAAGPSVVLAGTSHLAERGRRISVSPGLISFEDKGLAFNLLYTPGHRDVSLRGFQHRPLN